MILLMFILVLAWATDLIPHRQVYRWLFWCVCGLWVIAYTYGIIVMSLAQIQ